MLQAVELPAGIAHLDQEASVVRRLFKPAGVGASPLRLRRLQVIVTIHWSDMNGKPQRGSVLAARPCSRAPGFRPGQCGWR